jgi:hypothetical protein
MANSENWSRCLMSVLIAAAPALTTFSAQSHLDAQARNVHRTYARSTVQTTNINRNVNVNVHAGYGYDRWGHPVARAAAVTATAIAVGSVVASLPPHCTAMMVGAVTYQNCGGTYYQPRYQGTTVQYVVVNQP